MFRWRKWSVRYVIESKSRCSLDTYDDKFVVIIWFRLYLIVIICQPVMLLAMEIILGSVHVSFHNKVKLFSSTISRECSLQSLLWTFYFYSIFTEYFLESIVVISLYIYWYILITISTSAISLTFYFKLISSFNCLIYVEI